jgi:Tol biopolymer transport system component
VHFTKTSVPPVVRRLTANPEEDRVTAAALSVDGKHLAFSDRKGLHLRDVDSGETHLLSLPRAFDARPASWFPDGLHLLATWVADPQEPASLWEISLVGGAPRKLADLARWPAVSPDGSHIAFVSGAEAKWLGRDANQSIWIMQSDGTNLRKLLEDGDAPFGPPVWSPDGQLIAFAQSRYHGSKYHSGWMSGRSEIGILDIASGRRETILADEQLDSALAWLPDWRLVYSKFEARPNQEDSNLWSVRVDRAGRSSETATRLTSGTGAISELSSATNGKRLTMLRESLQPDVYVADLEAGGMKLSTPRRLTLDERQDFPFAWMPDNKSVVFASDRDGLFHVFKQSLDQPEPDLLVGGDEPVSGARLSPDSAYILYVVYPKTGYEAGRARLMRLAVAGGPPEAVLEERGMNNMQCARAPSTLCLFGLVDERGEHFFIFDPLQGKGKEIPQLLIENNSYASYNWSLSPDGHSLSTSIKQHAFTTSPDALSIQVISTDDYTRKTIPIPGWAGMTGLDWAANSKSLWISAYTTNDTWALLNVDLQGRVRPMLQENKMIVGWAIPSADGRHLALWEASGNANVWMLEKF